MIAVFIGASGVGKSTAADALLDRHGARYVLSYTSRSRRADEPDNGAMVYGVPKSNFELWSRKGEMEWVDEYAGNLYGTKKADLKDACEKETLRLMILIPPVLLRLDEKVKAYGGKVIYLFFDPPAREILEERTKSRDTSPSEHGQRMAKIEWYREESQKTGLPLIHISNEGTKDELVEQIVQKLNILSTWNR